MKTLVALFLLASSLHASDLVDASRRARGLPPAPARTPVAPLRPGEVRVLPDLPPERFSSGYVASSPAPAPATEPSYVEVPVFYPAYGQQHRGHRPPPDVPPPPAPPPVLPGPPAVPTPIPHGISGKY